MTLIELGPQYIMLMNVGIFLTVIFIIKLLKLFEPGRLFDYSSRINRSGCLIKALITIVLFFPVGIVTILPLSSISIDVFFIVGGIICAPFNIYLIILQIRRLHDLDLSGWFMIVYLIPFLTNLIFPTVEILSGIVLIIFFVQLFLLFLTLVMLFKKGTDGPNKYGEDLLKKVEQETIE